MITGEARLSPDDPPSYQMPVYLEKYRESITRSFGTPEHFDELYPVALRIQPIAIRGF